jgi:hypothetical protein
VPLGDASLNAAHRVDLGTGHAGLLDFTYYPKDGVFVADTRSPRGGGHRGAMPAGWLVLQPATWVRLEQRNSGLRRAGPPGAIAEFLAVGEE